MTDAKLLLDEATPLPWRSRRGYGPDKFAPKGYKYVQFGRSEKAADGRGTEHLMPSDADLIVYAVNHLPDYLAAVEALERLAAGAYHYGEPIEHMSCRASYQADGKCSCGTGPAVEQARAALARLRDKVPV